MLDLQWRMELVALVVSYGAAIACDLPNMTECEQFGLYLFLMHLPGG